MAPLFFGAFLLLSVVIALVDWRRGWYLAVACGMLQDPARKLTAGAPVYMTLSIVLVYAAVLVSAQGRLQLNYDELKRRFPNIRTAALVVIFFVLAAAVRGLFTFGLALWKVPALSLFTYAIPIPALLLGYTFVDDERRVWQFLKLFAIATSIFLIGVLLEYSGMEWRALGMVGIPGVHVRFLPGLMVPMLSGFYRAPDIMGWHAATLTIIGVVMAMRAKVLTRAWPWLFVSAWGFFNCMISGRRKAIYMVAVFAIVFVWRYARRLTLPQIVTFALAALSIVFVLHRLAAHEESSVYTRASAITEGEVFNRLEGGLTGTIEQFGLLGAGLGAATQGVHHLLTEDQVIGWQEGGLGKLAVELGVPGLVAAIFFAVIVLRLMLKISAYPDVPGSAQLLRVALFGMVVANLVEFLVSAQAYSDAVLTLMTAFLTGALFATSVLDERAAATERDLALPATA